jgi:hypothetical protein
VSIRAEQELAESSRLLDVKIADSGCGQVRPRRDGAKIPHCCNIVRAAPQ